MTSFDNTLVVTADAATPQRGTLRYGARTWPCVLGRSGIIAQKQEGDGGTPAGRFPLRRVLYRADQLSVPATALPVAVIAEDDGWCDDPADAAYNKPVKLPYGASAETMYRDDGLYDVVVIIGHNDDPVVPRAGSAIFMHVTPDNGGFTAGCVALAREDLLALLRAVKPGANIEIRA
ncbi:MAG: L,D-transpeptidase family protein [Rhodospirillaceae bacterium]|nr:L,D-transpeptidase family protein [Rhodospirillaceae bacterium]